MGRPRTATEILRARGAFRKDPQRARPGEPKPAHELRKSAPANLTPPQRAAWRRIVRICPPGVLKDSDEIVVELGACLLAEFQADPAGMGTSRIGRLMTLLGKLGLSPSDRAGLAIKPEDDDDEF